MKINIDGSAGFCWGVERSIDLVSQALEDNNDKKVYILGDIIHNPAEVDRLKSKGLETVYHDGLELVDKKGIVILRAHGEEPQTYTDLEKAGIRFIDATCPIVLSLQNKVRKYHEKSYEILIFGKQNHPETIGLNGACERTAAVIKDVGQALEKADPAKKTYLLSQTTMPVKEFLEIEAAVKEKFLDFYNGDIPEGQFISKNSCCKYVSGREDQLTEFARDNEVVLFVAGRESSNAKSLFSICLGANRNSHFIEKYEELDFSILNNITSLGITGATSTPFWYLEEIKAKIESELKIPGS